MLLEGKVQDMKPPRREGKTERDGPGREANICSPHECLCHHHLELTPTPRSLGWNKCQSGGILHKPVGPSEVPEGFCCRSCSEESEFDQSIYREMKPSVPNNCADQ